MRAYSFVHFQLSSMGKGIQSMHSFIEMRQKYDTLTTFPSGADVERHLNTYLDWAKNHKTLIVLNGGNCASLKELAEMFRCLDYDARTFGIPYCEFFEDEETLNGAITCVSIILPERIYSVASEIRNREKILFEDRGYVYCENTGIRDYFQPIEIQLIKCINSHSLAI